jgi:aryl-alcohol dehydrogenase-like predicted oxidoreductase
MGLYAAPADADGRVVEAVAAIAAKRDIPRAQVALSWVIGKPIVTAPIIESSKPQHLDDAIAPLVVRLTDDERRQLEAPYVPHAVVGFEQ